MEPTEQFSPPTAKQTKQNKAWWNALSDSWKQAFNETTLQRSDTTMPDDEQLHRICQSQVLRFAGPTAPYPNMTFELEDLSGVAAIEGLTILVVSHHKITSLEEISGLRRLSSLFVFNNQIKSLKGIENLTNLAELYFHCNEISSLKPLKNLTKLRTIGCNYNKISSFEGIGAQHKNALKTFTCLPNELVPDEEVIKMEREIGIRCVQG